MSVTSLDVTDFLPMTLTVVGDRDGTVYALNDATGAVVWSQSVHDKPIRGIGLDDSTLFVGTIDGHVIALHP